MYCLAFLKSARGSVPLAVSSLMFARSDLTSGIRPGRIGPPLNHVWTVIRDTSKYLAINLRGMLASTHARAMDIPKVVVHLHLIEGVNVFLTIRLRHFVPYFLAHFFTRSETSSAGSSASDFFLLCCFTGSCASCLGVSNGSSPSTESVW
jgi:hypothetical protein